MVKVLKKSCIRCKSDYLTYDEKKNYCNSECFWKHAYEIQRGIETKDISRECEWCGKRFAPKARGSRKYCDSICSKMHVNALGKKETDKKSCTSGKKRFIPGPYHGVSYSELNRREEFKRLYDKYYIDKIVRGKSLGG